MARIRPGPAACRKGPRKRDAAVGLVGRRAAPYHPAAVRRARWCAKPILSLVKDSRRRETGARSATIPGGVARTGAARRSGRKVAGLKAGRDVGEEMVVACGRRQWRTVTSACLARIDGCPRSARNRASRGRGRAPRHIATMRGCVRSLRRWRALISSSGEPRSFGVSGPACHRSLTHSGLEA